MVDAKDVVVFTHTIESPSEASIAPTNATTSASREPAIELRPQSARNIAQVYQVSDRTVQDWIKTVFRAYPLIAQKDLKLGSSNRTRYTPLCQTLIKQYRSSGLSAEDWIASVHATNATAQPAITPDILPAEPSASNPDSQAGLPPQAVPYVQSTDLGVLLSSRPQMLNTPIAPEKNLLYQMLNTKIAEIRQGNAHTNAQLEQVRQATQDTKAALDTLEDLRVVETAIGKADRHYALSQEIYRRRLEELNLQDLAAEGRSISVGKSQGHIPQPQSA